MLLCVVGGVLGAARHRHQLGGAFQIAAALPLHRLYALREVLAAALVKVARLSVILPVLNAGIPDSRQHPVKHGEEWVHQRGVEDVEKGRVQADGHRHKGKVSLPSTMKASPDCRQTSP